MAVRGPWPHGDPMPLSMQERASLADIEAGLRADPDFSLGGVTENELRRRRRRTVAAVLILIGIAMAVAGAAMAPRSSVAGLIVFLTGVVTVVGGAVVWLTTGRRERAERGPDPGHSR